MAEPDLTELAVILQDTLGRIDNTIIVTAPPAADLGSIGAVAIDLQNNLIYGPKTTSGWGVGRPTVGGPGPKGDAGDQGIQGDVGPKGDTGDTGPKGDKGDTGDTGPKGDKGDRGDAFVVNAQGDLSGRAAYDSEAVGFSYLDVEAGNLYFRISPSGWSGAIPFGKGDKGDQGDEGPEGPEGPAGADGADGAPGAPGSDATVTFATVAQVRAGKVSGVAVPPAAAAGAMALTALTDAATVTIDLDTGPNFTLLSTAGVGVGRTIGVPTNGNPGQFYTLQITADAIGRTVAWNTAFKWPKGAAKAIASAAANAVTLVSFRMISTSVFQVVGFVEDIK
jgi:hypothetical protein